MGISMLTGPVGAVMAICTARLTMPMAVSGVRMRKAALDTAFSMSSWWLASWMKPRFWSR